MITLTDDQKKRFTSHFAEDTRPELTVDIATRKDPDAYAESLNLSNQFNVPRDTAERNLNELRQRKLYADSGIEQIRQENPHLSKYLSQPDNAAVSVDDTITLKAMEDRIGSYGRTWGEFTKDTAIDIGSGVVSFGEMAVGAADIVTFNALGNGLEMLGYDPGETKETISNYYSYRRKQADRKVSQAKGFFDTFGTMLSEPMNAFGTILQSAPMMIGTVGAVKFAATKMLAKEGLKAGTKEAAEFLAKKEVAGKLAMISAGSEGLLTAGAIQEQSRTEGKDWLDTVLPSVLAGFSTAAISRVSSKILPDVEVTAATASLSKAGAKDLLSAGKEIAKSTFKEGVLEELPQSAQEQIFTNLALDKPWNEGVGEAAAQGLIAGAGMGGGMSTSTQVMAYMGGTEKEAKKQIKSMSEQDVLDDVIEYAQTSKTNKRAKENFENFVEAVGPEREVIIPNDIAMQLEGAPDYIASQINDLGTDISIPLKKFASDIAVNEAWMETIRPHIRLSQNTSSQAELDEGESSEIKALMEKAQYEKDVKTEADQIFETVRDQLVATNTISEQFAGKSAELIPAYVATMVEKAKKLGKTLSVQEGFEMMGFRVERGDVSSETMVEGEILDQSIPDDLEIAREGQETRNAKELTAEIDSKLEAYKKLRDCL